MVVDAPMLASRILNYFWRKTNVWVDSYVKCLVAPLNSSQAVFADRLNLDAKLISFDNSNIGVAAFVDSYCDPQYKRTKVENNPIASQNITFYSYGCPVFDYDSYCTTAWSVEYDYDNDTVSGYYAVFGPFSDWYLEQDGEVLSEPIYNYFAPFSMSFEPYTETVSLYDFYIKIHTSVWAALGADGRTKLQNELSAWLPCDRTYQLLQHNDNVANDYM